MAHVHCGLLFWDGGWKRYLCWAVKSVGTEKSSKGEHIESFLKLLSKSVQSIYAHKILIKTNHK